MPSSPPVCSLKTNESWNSAVADDSVASAR
jgi:hypothetical protein